MHLKCIVNGHPLAIYPVGGLFTLNQEADVTYVVGMIQPTSTDHHYNHHDNHQHNALNTTQLSTHTRHPVNYRRSGAFNTSITRYNRLCKSFSYCGNQHRQSVRQSQKPPLATIIITTTNICHYYHHNHYLSQPPPSVTIIITTTTICHYHHHPTFHP